MIIYSVVPPELIFEDKNLDFPKPKYINYKGHVLEVNLVCSNKYKINRIISTDLKAYLNPEIQPGEIITYENNN